jgi:diguanylate cyclase
VIGVEALARWNHPERGQISPAEFLPLAEASGQMRALTERIMDYSIRVAGDWWDSGVGLQLSVNLSPALLAESESSLTRFVERTLSESGVPAEALQFEITEDALLVDTELAAETLNRLSRLGSSISIDDFGTGHSSLGRLKTLPIDELKIDRSFVLEMSENANDRTIVRATIYLAHQLGLQVVAEGVETEEAWRQLRSMGCERAQGFLIAKPLPAREVLAWFVSWNQRARELSSSRRAEAPA